MLNIVQYPTYESLPSSAAHGDLALVTTGGVGVYQYVAAVNLEPVGIWFPADLAGRIVDYVRTIPGVASIELVSGGTGYAATNTVEPSGGTTDDVYGFDAVITVDSVSTGVITGATLTYHGTYLGNPSPLAANPVTTVTGGGSTATFNLTMQGQGSPVKISVGIGGDTVADVTARGWLTTTASGGVTPTDGVGYIQCASGTTSGGASGLVIKGLEDIGDPSTTEYLQVTQIDTSASATPSNSRFASFLEQKDGVFIVRQVYRTNSADNTSELTEISGGLQAPVGRGAVTFSAYETLFTRLTIAPPTLEANAEISQIWVPSEGRTKNSANALAEEFGTSGSSKNQYSIHATNYSTTSQTIGRIKEIHLFRLS